MKEEKAIMFKEVALAILGIAALWLITRGLWADCDPLRGKRSCCVVVLGVS